MKRGMSRFFSILLIVTLMLGMIPFSPHHEHAHAATPGTLYFKSNGWESDGARIEAYFFGGSSGEKWVTMTSLGNGYFKCSAPTSGYSKVIFVRADPGGAEHNWDSKWNQTADLTLPTNGQDCFSVNGWDNANGTWGYYVCMTGTHNYAAATCTKAKTCKNCSATSGSALGHSWSSSTGKCTRCSTACSHSWNSGTVTKAATCSATGVKTYTCNTCKTTKTETIAKTAHSYKDATCTAAKTCKNCGATTGSSLGHSYSSKVTKPTCTAQGYTTYTCSRCGSSYKDNYTAAKGHSYTYKVTKNPTTSASGTLVGTCSCGASTGNITIGYLGTQYHSYKVVKAATCTAAGTGRYTWGITSYGTYYWDVSIPATGHKWASTGKCSNCGTACSHSWNSGSVTTQPTCTANGVKTYTCNTCKATKTESVAAKGHSYTSKVTAPTCTAQGYTTYTCSTCSYSYKDNYTNAKGHSHSSSVTKQPTCTAEGVKTFTCACGDTYTEPVAAKGHSYSGGKCAACGDIRPVQIVGTFNDWSGGDMTYSATGYTFSIKLSAGEYEFKVLKDGAWLGNYGTIFDDTHLAENGWEFVDGYDNCKLNAIGGTYNFTFKYDTNMLVVTYTHTHAYTAGEVVTPTCTGGGYTTYTCACGDSYHGDEKAALGHSYTSKVTTQPGCVTEGVETFTCAACGDSYTKPVAAIGHNYKVTVTAPTCTEGGYTTHTCGNCGDTYKDSYKDATGHSYSGGTCTKCGQGCNHNWGTGSVTTQPTCTGTGVRTYTCSVCKHTKTEKIDALGHSYSSVVTKPTCTEGGYTTHTCSKCSHSYRDSEKAALGHSYTSKVTTQPGCTSEGIRTYTCGTCNHSYTEKISPIGHSYKKAVTAPTCTEKGYTTYTCSNCSDSYKADYVDAMGHSYVAGKCSVCGDQLSLYLVGWVNGADYDGTDYEFVGGKLVVTFTDATYVAVKAGTNWYMVPAYVDTTSATFYPANESCNEKMFVPVGAELTFTLSVGQGDSFLLSYEITHCPHSWGEGTVTKNPTCTAEGIRTYTCSICGETKTEPVTPAGHSYVGGKCGNCGDILPVAIPGEFNGWDSAPITWTEGGYTYQLTIPAGTYKFKVLKNGEWLGNSGTIFDDTHLAENGWEFAEGDNCTLEATGGIYCFTFHYDTNMLVVTFDHTHAYTAGEVVTPTCTGGGYTTYTCACGDSYHGDEKAALGHSYTSKVTTQPGCVTEGVETFTCAACGDSYTKPVAAIGHNYKATVTAPTCTEGGYTTHTCANCGDTYKDSYKDATGHSYSGGTCTKCGQGCNHNWGTGSVTTQPTCTGTGVRTYTCSVCKHTKTEKIDALGHSYVGGKCGSCGDILPVAIPGEFNGWDSAPITWTEGGYTYQLTIPAGTYKFKVLKNGEWLGNSGTIFDDTHLAENGWEFAEGDNCTLEATGGIYCFTFHYDTNMLVVTFDHTHAYTAGEVVTPTCTGGGYTTYTCACGDSYHGDEKAALGHSYTSKVTTQPGCVTEGVETFTCAACGDSYTKPVAAIGHNYKATVTAPTCTEGGYTTHTCANCGDTYKDSYKDATGHSYSGGTCTKCGQGCNHNWGTGSVTTQPTCTGTGVRTYTCSVCKHTKTEKIDALGHSYVGGECGNCGDILPVAIPGEFNGWDSAAITWTEGGYTYQLTIPAGTYKFKVLKNGEWLGNSGTIFDDTHLAENGWEFAEGDNCTLEATGGIYCFTFHYDTNMLVVTYTHTHAYTAGEVVAPTCTEGGYTVYTCVCGDSYQDDFVDALGHSYVAGKCSACGDQLSLYLVGWINGEDYDGTDYLFVDGKLVVTFTDATYVAVKAGTNWYMVPAYVDTTSATFYPANESCNEKMFVPVGAELTFTLSVGQGDSFLLSYEITHCPHSWGEGTVTKNPTCTAEGIRTYTCSICGETKTEPVASAGHTHVGGKCTACGDILPVAIPGEFNGWDSAAITWTEGGYTYQLTIPAGTYKFKVLKNGEWLGNSGTIFDDTHLAENGWEFAEGDNCTLEATGGTYTFTFHYDTNMLVVTYTHTHAYTAGEVVAPTCTEGGYTVYTCVCGDSYQDDFVDALGHSYVAGKCSVCGDQLSYYLIGFINGADYEGDEFVFVDGKLTLVFTEGSYVALKVGTYWYNSSEYVENATSATFYPATESINEKLYVPGHAEITFALTVGEGDSLILSYEAGECQHSYASSVTDPTCTAGGYTTHTCDYCGHSYTDSETGALGHNYVDGTCDRCGEAEPVITYITVYFQNNWKWTDVHAYVFLGDTYEVAWPGEPAIYHGNNGTDDIYCVTVPEGYSVIFSGIRDDGSGNTDQTPDILNPADGDCYRMLWNDGNTVEKDHIDIVLPYICPHAYESQVTGPACTVDGSATYTCALCGDSYTETIPAPGHNYVNGVCHCGAATDGVTIHLINTLGWSGTVAYAWESSTSTALNGWSWPGKIIHKDNEGYFTFHVDYEPGSGKALGLLFHNFNGAQTADILIDYATLSTSREIWVKPSTTANAAGQYTCTVAGSESGLVVSPEVNGTEVTFRYAGSATSVFLAGSFNGWSTSATALTKGDDGIWTVTMNLEPGVHEYKFVVNGSWVADPVNGVVGGYDGNSVVVVPADGETVNDGKITVVLHFYRANGNYSGWDVWFWGGNAEGASAFSTDPTNKGMIATFTVDGNSTGSLGYVIRKSDWSDKEFGDRFIDLTDVSSGTVHYFVNSGSATGSRVLGEDVISCAKPVYANYDYEAGTVWLKTSLPVSNPVASAFNIVDGNGNATSIRVTAVTLSGNGYTLKLSNGLTLSQLNSYKVRYNGCDATISINTHDLFYSDKFASEYTYNGNDLGATWSYGSTTFKVWAPTAKAVSVKIYASGNWGANDLLQNVAMTQGDKGVWYVTVSGNLHGKYYNYDVSFEGYTVEATDPYAKGAGVNGDRGMIVNMDATDPSGWDNDVSPNKGMSYTDAIIYETHIREFTIDASSGVDAAYRGKYLGLTQTGTSYMGHSTGLDYLKQLGITHIQLMPTYDFASIDEYHLTDWQQYAWGYDPKNFSVPEGSYATDPYNGLTRITEFKEMVQTFHENGINVVMDVVFNHTFDGGNYCGNKIVPNYYSRFFGEGNWSNGSGVGNDFATERSMVRNLIVDNILYWVEEYHIDGFRFDLAGLIDVQTVNEIVSTVHAKYPYVIFYGEGWAPGSTAVQDNHDLATKGNAWQTPGFGYFNDDYRNTIAGNNGGSWGFASGSWDYESAIANYFRAGNSFSSSPSQTVNYVSCHDNYCLTDKLLISRNGAYWSEIARMNSLSNALVLLSEGIPFIYSGDEMLREKKDASGNRYDNAYGTNDDINKIRWSDLVNKQYADVVSDYYAGLIAFRKNHAALRSNNNGYIYSDISFHRISDQTVLFYINGSLNGDCADGIVVIFNAGSGSVNVDLSNYGLPNGYWQACIHGDKAGITPLWGVNVGSAEDTIGVEGISTTVLVLGDLVDENSVYNRQSSNCSHASHNISGMCTSCGKTVSHNFANGTCACGLSGSAPSTYTVYFDNSEAGWESVNLYAWTETAGMTKEFAGTWPGSAMTLIDEAKGIWAYELPIGASHIIFNDGSGDQTSDLSAPGYTSDKVLYSGGQWVAYETCAHEYEDTVNIQVTCTMDGEVTHTCTLCGYSYTEVVEAPGHSITDEVREPTCTEGGCTVHFCSNCDYAITDSETAKLGHSYGEDGICSACGAEFKYYLFGYINGANYGSDGDEATMGEYSFADGQLVVTFDRTSYVAVKTTDNENWYMTDGFQEGATSVTLFNTAKGINADKLAVPGNVEITFTLVAGEDDTLTLSYTLDLTTCRHTFADGVCTVCGAVNPEACEHAYGSVVTDPTCTEPGYTTHTCTLCFTSYVDSETEALGHIYGADGTCTGCGKVNPETCIHEYDSVVTEPTCTAGGYTTHTCGICGDSYTDSETEPADHSYGEDGTCGICGAVNPDTCQHEYASVVTEPTCTAGGYTAHTCGICGDSYTDSETEPADHSYGEDGTCGICGGKQAETCEHQYIKTTVTANCTEPGGDKYTCSKCGDSYLENATQALGHTYDNGICSVCGDLKPLSTTYYLVGWINGGNHGCEEDGANMGDYKITDNMFKFTFRETSYVFLKTEGNGKWFMCDGYPGDGVCFANLYDTGLPIQHDKVNVPGGVEITFTLIERDDGSVTLTYVTAGNCSHNWYTQTLEWPGCTTTGTMLHRCIMCADSYTTTIPAKGHSYNGGSNCWDCGAANPNYNPGYYLVGWINGSNVGCEENWDQPGYSFSGGRLTVTFTDVSYVYLKTTDNAKWYMTDGYPGDDATSAKFYDTNSGINQDKLRVPAGVPITFYLTKDSDGSLTLRYTKGACAHDYSSYISAAPGCTTTGVRTYTCSKCGDSYDEVLSAKGHTYVDGACGGCGDITADYVRNYYLYGWINGANYGCEEDYANMGEFKFVDGKLTCMFKQDSYIAIKTSGNQGWYMARSYIDTTTGTFYNTSTGAGEKMFVPAGMEIRFTLTVNADDTLTLTYTANACEHEFGDGAVTTQPSCSAAGVRTYTCSKCGATETEAIEMLSHSFEGDTCTGCGLVCQHTYELTVVDATCIAYADFRFTCADCGNTIVLNAEDMADWMDEIPALMDSQLFETGTLYRCRDWLTLTSANPVEEGYELVSSYWVSTGVQKILYVAEWPAGFDVNSQLYELYNGTKLEAFETESEKLEITSDSVAGYLYYHWHNADGEISDVQTEEFSQFCAVYSDIAPETLNGNEERLTYELGGEGCAVSGWFFALAVYGQVAEGSAREYLHGAWSNWSAWSEEEAIASETRQVETKTVYRLPDVKLGDHAYEEVVTEPTCTAGGYTTHTCPVCGHSYTDSETGALGHNYVDGTCDRCGEAEPVITYITVYFQNNWKWTDVHAYVFLGDTYEVAWPGEPAIYHGNNGTDDIYCVTVPEGYSVIFSGIRDDGSGNTDQTPDILNPADGDCYRMLWNDGNTVEKDHIDNVLPLKPVVKPTITVGSPSVSFEGEIRYNFYFQMDDMSSVEEMGIALFREKVADGTVSTAYQVITDYFINGGSYMFQTDGIAPKNMADAVYFRIYAKLTDGTYVYSDIRGYNTVVYANSILSKSENVRMKALVVALLNYGAEAQKYFHYNEENLMNAHLSAEQQALVDAYDASMVDSVLNVDRNKVGIFGTANTGFAERKPSVSFDGAFSINYYMTTEFVPEGEVRMYVWRLEDYLNAQVLTAENASECMSMVATGAQNQYWANVSDIVAKHVDQTVFVACVYTSGGVEYSTGVLAYSVGAYCEANLTVTDSMNGLCAGAAVYSYYAKQYFADLEENA